MGFTARVYRVFVAATAGLEDERQSVVDAIEEWNALHSLETEMALQPVFFERSVRLDPTRPSQTVSNRDLAETCDLLIAVLWKSGGLPTASGVGSTLEATQLFEGLGRPVVTCFKTASFTPDVAARHRDDLVAIGELQDRTPPNLRIMFEDADELREGLRRHVGLFANDVLVRPDVNEDAETVSVAGALQLVENKEALARQASAGREADDRVLRPLMEKIHAERGSGLDVLDFGCGNGVVGRDRFEGSATVASVLGVDIHPAVVSHAQKLHGRKKAFTYRAGRFETGSENIGPFDLVFCSEVLEELDDPDATLEALWARLRPGGALYARSADDAMSVTHPNSRDMVSIMSISQKLDGVPDRGMGRKLLGHLQKLEGAEVEIAFDVRHTAMGSIKEREDFFDVEHQWRGSFAALAAVDAAFGSDAARMSVELAQALEAERDRFRSTDELFASAVHVLAVARKSAET